MRTNRIPSLFLVTVLLLSLSEFAVLASDEDPCRDQGITVKNLSFKDIWYQRKDGDCAILKRNYSFTIRPDDEMRLYSDMVCQTPYCLACKYSDFKAYDANNDCRIKMLPENAFSDI